MPAKRTAAILSVAAIASAAALYSRNIVSDDERIPETVILSLTDAPFELTNVEAGVYFDFEAVGLERRVAWTRRGNQDAFLAIDENHNGRIDDGAELIGGASGPPNGFRYLDAFDGFRTAESLRSGRRERPDGRIDAEDDIYRRLVLWTDVNHNGVSEEDEMQSLSHAGILALEIGHRQRMELLDRHGNRVGDRAMIIQSNGRSREFRTVRLMRGFWR